MASRRQPAKPDRQLELRNAAPEPERARTAPPAGHPPVILQLGRDFSVLVWIRDEGETPIYRVVKDRIKAASTAAVLARKLEQEARS